MIVLLTFIFILLLLLLKKNYKEYFNNLSCCLIQKKYLPDNNNINGGNFKYIYNILNNKMCSDPNSQFEIKSDINNCHENNNIYGSCRIANKECIDFVTKEFCNKYNKMVWSKKTCNEQLY